MKNLLNRINKKQEYFKRTEEYNTRVNVLLLTTFLCFTMAIVIAAALPGVNLLKTTLVAVLFVVATACIFAAAFLGYRTLWYAEEFIEEKKGEKFIKYKIFIYKSRWTPFTPKAEKTTVDTLDDVEDYYQKYLESKIFTELTPDDLEDDDESLTLKTP